MVRIILWILFGVSVGFLVYFSISVWVVESLPFTDAAPWLVASLIGAGFFWLVFG